MSLEATNDIIRVRKGKRIKQIEDGNRCKFVLVTLPHPLLSGGDSAVEQCYQ
jgi:hypothetical protein